MRYRIIRQSRDRLHLELVRGSLSSKEADVLYFALCDRLDVAKVQVFPRTGQVSVQFRHSPEEILQYLDSLPLDGTAPVKVPSVSARATNDHFKEKIIDMLLLRGIKRFLLPMSVRTILTFVDAAPFVWHGLKDVISRKFSAEIVHASAISASLAIADYPTASSIIFLTELGELLEQWTYKTSVDNLAQSLALNISRVWKVSPDGGPDVQVNIETIAATGADAATTMASIISLGRCARRRYSPPSAARGQPARRTAAAKYAAGVRRTRRNSAPAR